MENKERYILFAQNETQLPLFFQPWWLDAVSAGMQWDVLLSLSPEGEIQAALPYLTSQKLKMRYASMPAETPFLGVYIPKQYQDSIHAQREIVSDLARQLEQTGLSYFSQLFVLQKPVAALFQEQQFKTKERNGYQLYDLSDLNHTLDSFSKGRKKLLQRALTLTTDSEMQAEDFYRFHQDCLLQKKKQMPYSREFLLVIQKKAERAESYTILRIRNAAGNTLAAAFLVWDQQRLYYLLPAVSPTANDTGAEELLIWEAIKLAGKKQLIFDFAMTRKNSSFCKQFAAESYSCFEISKYYKGFFRLINFFRWLGQIGK